MFRPKVLNAYVVFPDGTNLSTPSWINFHVITSDPVAVKWTTPVPSPFGLSASAPAISAVILIALGAFISPSLYSSCSHPTKARTAKANIVLYI